MSHPSSAVLSKLLRVLAALVVLKVTATVVYGYRNYLPPNFESDFLAGREGYFFGDYQWAFYAHIAAGPCSLVIGLMLISDRFRLRFPGWHRVLGRIQVANVLLLIAPSGFWMARHAAAGPVAGVAFALLAGLTALTAALGWRTAMQRRFAVHRRWMQRCFLLLCSTVILRLSVGLLTVLDWELPGFGAFIAWASWLVPLLIFEILTIAFKEPRPSGRGFFVKPESAS